MNSPTGDMLVQPPGLKSVALLGLVSGHFGIKKKADVEGDVLGTVTQELNAGIAVVTPADTIHDLLMREDVVEDRVERIQKARKGRPSATFDSGIAAAQDTDEYARFEDLARKLVNTPKSEIDEKRKAES